MNINKPDVTQDYLRYSEINNYLDYLARRYVSFVTVTKIGKSHEGRVVKAIKIDRRQTRPDKCSADSGRNWIFIEAGTHSREWITITVALYCIYQLTERHGRNLDILDRARFLIIPLSNPDGYEYAHEKNPNWRKNRRPNSGCKVIGTDLNRNYDFQWEKGSSKPSKNTYKGEAPFSEKETCAIKCTMDSIGPHIQLLLTLHSYAQTIMYPWGYTKDLPVCWKQLHEVADTGRKAIQKVTGRKYSCGSISKTTGRTYTGSIVDYAFGVVKVPFAICMELPASKYGFQPAKELIKPIGEESWIGIKAMCQKAMDYSSFDPVEIESK